MAMTTRLRRLSLAFLVAVPGLAGCARLDGTAEPPAWRRVAPDGPLPPTLPSAPETFRA